MSEREWVVVDINDFRNQETSVSAWRPGDGLACSYRKRGHCGPPAALVRVRNHAPAKWDSPLTTWTLCALHVASRLKTEQTAITTDVEKRAREQVVAAHWDEYQAALAEARDEVENQWLAVLPDDLREQIKAAAKEES